jgi:hypothetical protein
MKNVIRICAVILALSASATGHAETLLQQYQVETATLQLTDENLIVGDQVVKIQERREFQVLIVKEFFERSGRVIQAGFRPACQGIVQDRTTWKFGLDFYRFASSSVRFCDDTIELKREDGSEEIVAVQELTVQKLQEILQNVGIQLQ